MLIPDERKITGSQAEVVRYFDHAHFEQKGNVIAHLETEDERAGRTFLTMAWKDFPRRFEYTDEQFERCMDIRAYCSNRVSEVRGELGWRRYQRDIGFGDLKD